METSNALAITTPAAVEQVNRSAETASTAAAALVRATVESRYIMAERHPRDLDVVRGRILKDCTRPSFAAVAIYRKPIGRGVEGPSIRFAESALRNMGNVDISTVTVYDDNEKRIVRVTVLDLESNVPYAQDVTITKTVERLRIQNGETPLSMRINSRGERLYVMAATDDDILNKQNALISKAVRTLGLRLIPGDIVDEAMQLVRETQQKSDAVDPDAAKRKLFDAFARLNISAEKLKQYLGSDAETLSPAELVELRGLYSALNDGETSWREVMDAKRKQSEEPEKRKRTTGLAAAVAAHAEGEVVRSEQQGQA